MLNSRVMSELVDADGADVEVGGLVFLHERLQGSSEVWQEPEQVGSQLELETTCCASATLDSPVVLRLDSSGEDLLALQEMTEVDVERGEFELLHRLDLLDVESAVLCCGA
jgi:hypothetical protein